jgi:hypothetical protein
MGSGRAVRPLQVKGKESAMTALSLRDPQFGRRFAEAWIENWNRRDIPAILSHFIDDCRFESPMTQAVVGASYIADKTALERYWRAAVDKIAVLRFELEDAGWDPVRRILLVRYVAQLDERRLHACEVMVFNTAGQQTAGYAYYGRPDG